MSAVIITAFILVALIIAAIVLIQSKGTALLAWAVFLLALAALIPRIF